jgi:signal transduction histidine kinase
MATLFRRILDRVALERTKFLGIGSERTVHYLLLHATLIFSTFAESIILIKSVNENTPLLAGVEATIIIAVFASWLYGVLTKDPRTGAQAELVFIWVGLNAVMLAHGGLHSPNAVPAAMMGPIIYIFGFTGLGRWLTGMSLVSMLVTFYLMGEGLLPAAVPVSNLHRFTGACLNIIALFSAGFVATYWRNSITADLVDAKRDLEDKVCARTLELEISRNEALKANDEKRKLIQKVDSAVEDERKHIAIEIHDEFNATLLSVRLNSQRIVALADTPAFSLAQEEVRERALSNIKTTASLYAIARNIVKRLRPESLDVLGLQGAAAEMLHNYEKLHPTCRVVFNSSGNFSVLEESLTITAYRLIQEALSNVAKHTDASRVSVTMIVNEDERELKITIVDNGIGFDLDSINPGVGLIGMRERVAAFDGSIDFVTEAGAGTVISILFRLATSQELPGMLLNP